MIPFNAKFSPSDEDYDPLISEKIVTSEVLSYVLNRALIGAKRLISQDTLQNLVLYSRH